MLVADGALPFGWPGSITYAVLHLWDAWTVLTSPANWLLSIIFLFFTYFGPGMMKTVLTVRTGNAWTHWGPITPSHRTPSSMPRISWRSSG